MVLHGVACALPTSCQAVGGNSAGKGVLVGILNGNPTPTRVVPDTYVLKGIDCPHFSHLLRGGPGRLGPRRRRDPQLHNRAHSGRPEQRAAQRSCLLHDDRLRGGGHQLHRRPVTPGASWRSSSNGRDRAFCGAGCRRVAVPRGGLPDRDDLRGRGCQVLRRGRRIPGHLDTHLRQLAGPRQGRAWHPGADRHRLYEPDQLPGGGRPRHSASLVVPIANGVPAATQAVPGAYRLFGAACRSAATVCEAVGVNSLLAAQERRGHHDGDPGQDHDHAVLRPAAPKVGTPVTFTASVAPASPNTSAPAGR